MDGKFSKPTYRLVNVKGTGLGEQKRDVTLWGGYGVSDHRLFQVPTPPGLFASRLGAKLVLQGCSISAVLTLRFNLLQLFHANICAKPKTRV
jgi:hypothetical protein